MTSAIMRSERPALLPPRLRRGLRRLGLRAQGSAQLAAGLALALALATYDASDPAANVASGGATSNVLGAGGAWIADWLLRGFGMAAAAAALAPIAWGCRGLKLKRTRRTALRLAALALVLPCLAMGLAALQGFAGWPLREGPGGFVGSVLLHHAALLTGGAAWAAAAALGLGVPLAAWAFGFDLEDWAWVGAGTVAAGRGLRRLARAAPLPAVGLPGHARGTEAPQRTPPPDRARPAPARGRGGRPGAARGRGGGAARAAGAAAAGASAAAPEARAGAPAAQPAARRRLHGAARRTAAIAAARRRARHAGRRNAGAQRRAPDVGAGGFRHRRRGGGDAAGPRGDALRVRAAGRDQVVARHRPCGRHRALHVGGVGARGRGSRPHGDRHRNAEPHPPDGLPARADRDRRLRTRRRRPAADPRQGHRRRPQGRPAGADAAPADRRHDGLRQVGGDQHHDPLAALPAGAGALPAHHGRSEDAGALGL